MIKAIAIDDEKHCLITLEHHLNKTGEINLLAVIQDSTAAVEKINELKPDIVFIDIEMPGMNGFEVLNRFETLPFKVVFTTAYDQYAIKALKMNALDYLLKPVAYEDIKEVIEKFKNSAMHQSKEQISHLYRFSKGKMQDTIALSMQEGLLFVKIEDIMYIEGSGSYSYIVMTDKSKHLASKNISLFEEVLEDNPLFFRAHKSFMVNIHHIRQYLRGEGGEIIMKDGKSVSLSRNKKQEFLDLFKRI